MDDFQKQMETVMNEFRKKVGTGVEEALTEASQIMVDAMARNSPEDTSHEGIHLKDCWGMKVKYHRVRYVGNTRVSKDGIPLTSLLEYSVKGKPFMVRVFEANKDAVLKMFTKSLGGKL